MARWHNYELHDDPPGFLGAQDTALRGRAAYCASVTLFVMAGRPSRLEDVTFLKRVAECFYDGLSRKAMCAELGVADADTITRWRRDPRVKTIVGKLNEDRVMQISRKVDSIIEGRLAHAKELDTETLIKIRKEYGGSIVARKETDEGATIAEAMAKLEENPHFAEELEDLIRGSAARETEKQEAEDVSALIGLPAPND